MKHTVIFSDRDGTINYDENYYLGSNPNWKSQVKIIDSVIEGIRLINSIPNSFFFIITNQSGVALKGGAFDNLSESRMHEVNEYIISLLKKKGLRIDGYFACPFVDQKYVNKALARGLEVDARFIVDGHSDLKPGAGMLLKALDSVNLKRENCDIYVIGDRASDLETALKIKGEGFIVQSIKTLELGDVDKVKTMGCNAKITETFLEACQIIFAKQDMTKQ